MKEQSAVPMVVLGTSLAVSEVMSSGSSLTNGQGYVTAASLDPAGSDGPDRRDRWAQSFLPGRLIALQETSCTDRQGWLDLVHPPPPPEGACPAWDSHLPTGATSTAWYL